MFEQVKPIYALTWVSLCSFKALLASYNIYYSPVLISLLLSTKSLNSCIDPPTSTYKKSNVSYGISSLQSLMAYSFATPYLSFSKPTQTLIEPVVPTIENLPVVSVFFLTPISFHGPPANNGQLYAPAMNQNISPLLPPLLNSSCFNLCFTTLVFISPHHPP
jgi:hypothetical protein